MRRTAVRIVVAVTVLIAAGLALALWTVPASQPASQLVVQGRVTGTDGKPVSGIKVWLNAWPEEAVVKALTLSHQQVPVRVVNSAITSATGRYAIRVLSPAALAPQATDGIIKFAVMVGDSTGWDSFSFSGRLVQTAGVTMLAFPSGGTVTAELRLMRHEMPKVPSG